MAFIFFKKKLSPDSNSADIWSWENLKFYISHRIEKIEKIDSRYTFVEKQNWVWNQTFKLLVFHRFNAKVFLGLKSMSLFSYSI